MEKFRSGLGMGIVIKKSIDTSEGFCESCRYWDERTHWCEERESYGETDRIWACEQWKRR